MKVRRRAQGLRDKWAPPAGGPEAGGAGIMQLVSAPHPQKTTLPLIYRRHWTL